MEQTKAYTLSVEGREKTVQAILDVQEALAKNRAEIAKLNKESKEAGGALANLTKENERLRKSEQSLNTELERVTQRMQELRSQNKQASNEYKQLKADKEALTNQINKNATAIQKNEQSQDRYNQKLETARQKTVQYTLANQELTVKKKALHTAQRQEIKDFEEINKNIPKDSIIGLNNEYSRLIKQYNLLSEAERKSAAGNALRDKLKRISDQTIKLNKEIGNIKANIGNYDGAINKLTGSLRTLLGALGVGSALFVGVQLLRDAGQVVRDFNKAQVELQALSGKTAKELEALTQDAKRLGVETLFSATKVTQLQIELSKLGFENEEIQNSTKAIIDFAVAMDAEAAPAATVAASTMRAFGIATTETERVVSVLGVAANKTALSFSDFEGNIATFAPVARQFGFTLEDSITLFGKLRDAGFDASTAATALRNIILKMADANGDLAKRLGAPIKSLDDFVPALQKLKDEGIDLGEAFELTGERSVAAFGQLLQDSDTLITLRDSLTDVNDEFQVMVEKRLQSVDAQLKLTRAAWEGMIVSIEDGDGTISKAVAGFLGGLQGVLKTVIDINNNVVTWKAVFEDLGKIWLTGATAGISIIDRLFGGEGINFTSSVKEQQEANKAILRNAETQAKKLFDLQQNGFDYEKKFAEERLALIKKNAEAGDKLSIEFLKQYELLAGAATKVIENDDDVVKKIDTSLDGITKRIAELNSKMQSATSDAVRAALARTIAGLEEQKKQIEDSIKAIKDAIIFQLTPDTSIEGIQTKLSILKGRLDEATTDAARNAIQAQIDELEIKAAIIQKQLERFENKTAARTTLTPQGFTQTSFGALPELLGFKSTIGEEANDDLLGRNADERLAEQQRIFEEMEKQRLAEVAFDAEMKDILLQQQEDFNNAHADLIGEFGAAISAVFSDSENDYKEVFKRLLNLLLKFVESQIKITQKAELAKATLAAALDPILTAKLIAKAALMEAITSAVFGVLRSIVQSFNEGGKVLGQKDQASGKKITRGLGTYHRPIGSKDSILIHAKPDEAVLTTEQQEFIKHNSGNPNIFADAGVKGFGQVPTFNNVVHNINNGNTTAEFKNDQMLQFASMVSERTADAIVHSLTGNRILERKRLLD